MTDEQLKSMSEQEIRARYRCAPAYYLQAKLERKRTLEGAARATSAELESRWEASLTQQSQRRAPLCGTESLDRCSPSPEPAERARRAGEGLDMPLPGFDILDAALSEYETLDDITAWPMDMDSGDMDSGDMDSGVLDSWEVDAGLTQQAILEAALEDYSNWPIRSTSALRSEPHAEPPPESELERKLTLVLEAAPELKVVLDAAPELDLALEPDLEVVLHSDPQLDTTLESEPASRCDNVTMADFGHRAPRTVPVVSVAMDRKRPNMVRVVGKSTRLAS